MMASNASASSACASWDSINWTLIVQQVYRLQLRIAKAIAENRHNKVKALQWLLTHSHAAKLLAVKRVTQSKGANTPGVDGITWKSAAQKIRALPTLQRRNYKAQPLRRVYIPKKNGKLRPLGIPTIKDRAMQALYLLALEPVSESTADKNSYGFRPKRSTADAIEQCFTTLVRSYNARWVLEGDIAACFDRINHTWLMNHVITDKKILAQWLKAGYMEQNLWHATDEGTPQGGVASPTLANLTLDGLEKIVKTAAPKKSQKINFIRYADDFVITGESKALLENTIKPVVIQFLSERGLTLSAEKTKITHIDQGFDFLGFNIRKYNGKLLIKPAKTNVKSFLRHIRKEIKEHGTVETAALIRILNPKITGWANYYRHVVSAKIFHSVDHEIYKALRKWIKRRHPHKNEAWRMRKYYRSSGLRNWIFSTKTHGADGEMKYVDLATASSIPIRRHVKIKSAAHPYDPIYRDYFQYRASRLARQRLQKRHMLTQAMAG